MGKSDQFFLLGKSDQMFFYWEKVIKCNLGDVGACQHHRWGEVGGGYDQVLVQGNDVTSNVTM